MGAGLRGVAGRTRGVSGQEEDETKIWDSMLSETAESPPQERRWDIAEVGRGKLISKKSEGVSTSCLLKQVEVTSLQLLLPQRVPPTVDVNPSHGCESCQFKAQLLQHPEFCVSDFLDVQALWSSGTSSSCRRTRSATKAASISERLRGYLCDGERCSLMYMQTAPAKAKRSSESILPESLLDQTCVGTRIWSANPLV